ncbi:hypothetical protein G9C85_16490 [Halorubellus sp. JP-L1]|uniref:DUF7519 family protein n=1 Tax=Halorubellus sp. JP-L1 TaxID=2715753 RepID=UPI00140791F8|nr:hypothetical protein [Halorubellus sp. JP-L1]NHN43217.1 hypothetical protein [Halorubellus sp. JP-L1]
MADGVGDRPSARGRDRTLVTEAVATTPVSGSVVVGATALTVLAVGVVLGVLEVAALGLVAGGVLAVAATLCNREGPLATAAGSVAVAVGVLATAVALSRPLTDPTIPLELGPAIFAVGALVAGLGAVATVPGSLGDGQWRRTVMHAGASTVLPGLVVAWAVLGAVRESGEVVDAAASAAREGVDALVFPQGPNANVGGFVVLAALAALALAFALRTLPVANLVAKTRRTAVSKQVDVARRWLFRAGVAGVGLGVLLTAVPTMALHDALRDAGVETMLGIAVDAGWLRALLLMVAVVAASATVATVAVRRVAQLDGRRVVRVLATTVPGGLLLLAGGAVRPEFVLSRLRIGPVSNVVDAGVDALGAAPLALAVLASLVLAVTVALSALTTAAAMGFVPNRTAAPSVAAGGVLLVAVAAGFWTGEHALATFAAVVASMVVWDVGNYGVDVTAELDGTTSRVVEVLHAAGSATVGVALVGVGLGALWASDTLAAGGGIDGPGLLGLVLLVVAAVALMSTLRG